MIEAHKRGVQACGYVGSVAAGWNAARRGLFDTLASSGLPRTAPLLPPVEAPARIPAPQPGPFWPMLVLAAALTAMLVAAVMTRRPRGKERVLG
jgi:hypothetical protein